MEQTFFICKDRRVRIFLSHYPSERLAAAAARDLQPRLRLPVELVAPGPRRRQLDSLKPQR
jgi:hypothetical protein